MRAAETELQGGKTEQKPPLKKIVEYARKVSVFTLALTGLLVGGEVAAQEWDSDSEREEPTRVAKVIDSDEEPIKVAWGPQGDEPETDPAGTPGGDGEGDPGLENEPRYEVTIRGPLNIRSGPSTDAPVVGVFNPNGGEVTFEGAFSAGEYDGYNWYAVEASILLDRLGLDLNTQENKFVYFARTSNVTLTPLAAPEPTASTPPPTGTEGPGGEESDETDEGSGDTLDGTPPATRINDFEYPQEVVQNHQYDPELGTYVREGNEAFFPGLGWMKFTDEVGTQSFGTVEIGLPAEWRGEPTSIRAFDFTERATPELWENVLTEFWLSLYMKQHEISREEAMEKLQADEVVTLHWTQNGSARSPVRSMSFKVRPSRGLSIVLFPDMINTTELRENYRSVRKGEMSNSAFGVSATESGRLLIVSNYQINSTYSETNTILMLALRFGYTVDNLVNPESRIERRLDEAITHSQEGSFREFARKHGELLRGFGLGPLISTDPTDLEGDELREVIENASYITSR